jgi:hypothetical protein
MARDFEQPPLIARQNIHNEYPHCPAALSLFETWAKRGEGPEYFRIGRGVYYKRSDIEAICDGTSPYLKRLGKKEREERQRRHQEARARQRLPAVGSEATSNGEGRSTIAARMRRNAELGLLVPGQHPV